MTARAGLGIMAGLFSWQAETTLTEGILRMRRSTRWLLALAWVVGSGGALAWAQTAPAGADAPAIIEGEDAPAADKAPAAGDEQKPPPQDQQGKGRDQWKSMAPLLLMLGGFVLLWMWMGRGKRKQQQQRKQMIAALKKGDKVVTIGGIVGTVMEVRGDEVTVKVDESSNVRMRFARWSIRGVGEGFKNENPDAQRRESSESK